MKFFNIAGPCDERFHYMIPAAARLPEASKLVARGEYFAVHAPRQTGKSTTLRAIARELTASGRYAALYVSCAILPSECDDPVALQRHLIDRIAGEARCHLPEGCRPPLGVEPCEGMLVARALRAWAMHADRPLVLLLDDIEALMGRGLLEILAQIRALHPTRPERAPWSIVFCGLHDVGRSSITGRDGHAVPFNITSGSLRLPDFTHGDVTSLFVQHAESSGQRASVEAIERIVELTAGQPWLVNAIGHHITHRSRDLDGITPALVKRAARQLIIHGEVHFQALLDCLRQTSMRELMAFVLTDVPVWVRDEDVQQARDIGLIARDAPLRGSNAIHDEVVARALGFGSRRIVSPTHSREPRA